jgi:predicted adenylyl cyclase CyaB
VKHLSIEIKSKCNKPEKIRAILKSKRAQFKGIDHQIDTYFQVNNGRLKLREGNIENYLIFYEREDKKGPKQSKVMLFPLNSGSSLKTMLSKSNNILTVVDKKREIYFIDNVKFHLDRVKGLGNFIEIEALGLRKGLTKMILQKQCQSFIDEFDIKKEDLLSVSYSDLLMNEG